MSASITYEDAIDSIRDTVGDHIPTDIAWPDDLVDRVTGDVVDGWDTVKTTVVPAATVAVGAGSKAASSTGNFVRRHPALTAAGVVGLVALIVLVVRRRRDSAGADDRADS